jgi:hypothetical protein
MAIVTLAVVSEIIYSNRMNYLKIIVFCCAVVGLSILLIIGRDFISNIVLLLGQSSDDYGVYRTGLSSGLAAHVFNSKTPVGYFMRIGYALISPFPTLNNGIEGILLSLGTIIQFIFLPFLLLGIFTSISENIRWMLILTFLFFFIGMAFFTFEPRQILQYLPFGILITAIGYDKYERYKSGILFSMLSFGTLLMTIYLILKM